TTAPVLSGCPAADGGTYQCLADVPGAPPVTASDACGSPVRVDFSGDVQSNPGSSCNNSITRTWTATNLCNLLTSSCSQIITVHNTTAPVISPAPGPVTVQCASDIPAAGTLSATGHCGETLTATPTDGQAGRSV